jgi:hypothetical protein
MAVDTIALELRFAPSWATHGLMSAANKQLPLPLSAPAPSHRTRWKGCRQGGVPCAINEQDGERDAAEQAGGERARVCTCSPRVSYGLVICTSFRRP